MQAALRFFAPDVAGCCVSELGDCMPYETVCRPTAPIFSAQRMATLAGWWPGCRTNSFAHSLNAATARVAGNAMCCEMPRFFRPCGLNRIDESPLSRGFLGAVMGFVQSPDGNRNRGNYAIRGGIIDFFHPVTLAPCGLICIATTLDGAPLRFDSCPASAPHDKSGTMKLAPVSEVILDESAITRFRQTTGIEFGGAGNR